MGVTDSTISIGIDPIYGNDIIVSVSYKTINRERHFI